MKLHLRIAPSICVAFAIVVATLTLNSGLHAQQKADKAATQSTVEDQSLKNAAQKGLPLNAVSTVADQASVEAVLIPASVARRIFGKEVANNYAVIEVIVSNKDSKAALIVQSVFLDYSKWLLSGISSSLPPSPNLTTFQKANQPWQVASVESRLVRGELLDAQQWTARNWTIRALTAIGSVAAAYEFPFSGDVAKGVAAFTGVVVPGASTLWPDGTVSQVNRISDFGFRTNMIIPKQASDLVVAFFPIDRFLTPTFRKLFLTNPAGFFVPGELLTDPKTSGNISQILLPMAQALDSNISQETLTKKMTTAFLADCSKPGNAANTDGSASAQGNASQPQSTSDCKFQDLFTRLSLNSVRVVVGGVMSVDVSAVPGTIYEVDFDDGNTNSAIWMTTGTDRTGKITGLYLSGGTPYVVDDKGTPIDGVTITAVPDNSSDTEQDFKMSVSKCIDPATKVFFVVAKQPETSASSASDSTGKSKPAQTAKNAVTGVASTPFQFSMPAYVCPSDTPPGNAGNGAAADNSKKPAAPADKPPVAPAATPKS